MADQSNVDYYKVRTASGVGKKPLARRPARDVGSRRRLENRLAFGYQRRILTILFWKRCHLGALAEICILYDWYCHSRIFNLNNLTFQIFSDFLSDFVFIIDEHVAGFRFAVRRLNTRRLNLHNFVE